MSNSVPHEQSSPVGQFFVPGLTIRPCRPGDEAFLRRLYRTSREQELAATGWTDVMKREFCNQQYDAQRDDWRHRFPQAHWLLLLDRREPVGRLYYDPSGEDLLLIDICLLPKAQGRGRGRALLEATSEQARRLGKASVSLSLLAWNQGAYRLYLRQGFVETRRDSARIYMRQLLSA